jgi:two-component system, sensor histidine kinase FlrB
MPIPLAELQAARASAERSEEFLSRSFASFAGAAASLERSYIQLQAELARLRHELEETNRDLASSLQENHRNRQHLHAILQSLPCGVLVVDRKGTISLANPEAQQLLDAEPQPTVPAALQEILQRAQSEGSEMEWPMGKSATRWITLRRAELSDAEGGSSIFILQDVSGLKRLQQEHEMLRRQQALAELSGVLAHEIRNPLGSLELFAGVLAESGLTEEQRRWVEHLQAGLRMLAATVNNVLHFHSRPQPGFAPTDLGELLRSLFEFLHPLAQRAEVCIAMRPGCEGILVAADRDRLRQVVLNLALNSLHFVGSGGEVSISGGRHEHTAWVEVADSGPGIAEENLEKIFEPGFTTRAGSAGLGLAVCKTIMEQHRGTIRVSSLSGHGTTFTLELPLWREQP